MAYPDNSAGSRLRITSSNPAGPVKIGDVLTIVVPPGVQLSSEQILINRGAGYVLLSSSLTYTLQAGDIPPLGTAWPVQALGVVSNLITDPLPLFNQYIAPVSLGLPVIAGSPVENQALAVYAPGFSGNGLTIIRTFYADGVLVATAASYTPPTGSVGKRFSVTEVATNPLGSATSAGPVSAPCAPSLVTLPTPILLESFDSETGKTYAGSGTHAIVSGQVQGTGQQQLTSPGSNVTLFCTATETGPFNIASMNTLAWWTTKDANQSVSDRVISLSRGGTVAQQSGGADGVLKNRIGGQYVAVNINQPAFAAVAALPDGTLTVSPRVIQFTPFLANVTIDALVYNAQGRSIFAPIWDDAAVGVIANLLPLLAEFGIKGTFAIPVNFIGLPGRLNWDQVRYIASLGHCIIGNTKNDVGIVTGFASDAALVADYTNVDGSGWKEILLAQVPSAWVFAMALSNGEFNEARLSALQAAGLLMARTTDPQYLYNRMGFGNNGATNGQQLTVPSQGTSTSINTATVINQLNLAELIGALQSVHGHNVTNTPTSIDWTPAQWRTVFTAFAAKRAAGTMVNMTYKEVYDYTSPLTFSNPGT